MSFFPFPCKIDKGAGARFDLFLYLPVNRMFVTIWTEFSQLQSIMRIVPVLLSNISGNAR